MAERRARISYVTVDCHDPRALAVFWRGLLGVEIAGDFGDAFVVLARPSDDEVAMAFQRVPEGRVVKNRVHPDLAVDDLEGVTAWVEANGGERLEDHEEEGYRWRVMRDPEGNEFCLAPSVAEPAS